MLIKVYSGTVSHSGRSGQPAHIRLESQQRFLILTFFLVFAPAPNARAA